MKTIGNGRIFLLGGFDLEMKTIHELLKSAGETAYSNNLNWNNALLEKYTDIIEANSEKIIYAIELRENGFSVPAKYVRIDHHDDYQHKKTSLEQIADILGVKLTRHQQLVAANDRGYIRAMKNMGALDCEIAAIRSEDRLLQGVTQADEIEADRLVKNLDNDESIEIQFIKTTLEKFSPIYDRLYKCKNVVIYNAQSLYFSGIAMQRALNIIKHIDCVEIRERYNQIYVGGDANSGYFGTPIGLFTENEIVLIILKLNKLKYA